MQQAGGWTAPDMPAHYGRQANARRRLRVPGRHRSRPGLPRPASRTAVQDHHRAGRGHHLEGRANGQHVHRRRTAGDHHQLRQPGSFRRAFRLTGSRIDDGQRTAVRPEPFEGAGQRGGIRPDHRRGNAGPDPPPSQRRTLRVQVSRRPPGRPRAHGPWRGQRRESFCRTRLFVRLSRC